MILYSEALDKLRDAARRRAVLTEQAALAAAVGRVVREEVSSPEAVPPFDNSAMDGFALRAEATREAVPDHPVRLSVKGLVAAGDRALPQLDASAGAVEIMTGAPILQGGFDSVVKLEDVEVRRRTTGEAEWIQLRRPVGLGENVRRRGEDFARGQAVLTPGTRFRPEHVMALASLGVAQIPVAARPRVAVIATGKELIDHAERSLPPGGIRNSTTPYLLAALPLCGAEARFLGVVADDPAHFAELFARALELKPDVVLVTGGISMGKFDFVLSSLEAVGAAVRFQKVAIRPGKPVLFAELASGPSVFGMPGNPIATAVALRFFVEPYLRAISGESEELPVKARLSAGVTKPEGLRCFYKASLQASPMGLRVRVLPGQASFMVSPLLHSNSWVFLPEQGAMLSEGTDVDVFPLLPWAVEWNSNEEGRLT